MRSLEWLGGGGRPSPGSRNNGAAFGNVHSPGLTRKPCQELVVSLAFQEEGGAFPQEKHGVRIWEQEAEFSAMDDSPFSPAESDGFRLLSDLMCAVWLRQH